MTIRKTALSLVLLTAAFGAGSAWSELQIHKDYELSKVVSSVTTVKVDANMGDLYLEGIRDTWVEASKVSKELGQIKDYYIYVSQLPDSGEFNIILIVEYNSIADLEPSKARFDAFMQKWGEANEKRNRKLTKTYPDIRTITGEYIMRELTMK